MLFIDKKLRIFEVPFEYIIHPLTTRTTHVLDGVGAVAGPRREKYGFLVGYVFSHWVPSRDSFLLGSVFQLSSWF